MLYAMGGGKTEVLSPSTKTGIFVILGGGVSFQIKVQRFFLADSNIDLPWLILLLPFRVRGWWRR